MLSIFLIYFSDGFRFYIPPPDLEEAPTEKIEANIAVIGDSHAHHLEYGLKVLINGMVKMYQSPGCIPFRDVDRYDHRQKAGDCVKHTNNSLDLITQSKVIDTVILSTMRPVYLDNTVFQKQDLNRIIRQNVYDIKNPNIKDRYKIFENGFERTVNELHNKNKKIIFIIDIPELGISYKSCIMKNIKITWRPLGPIVKGKVVDKDNCKYDKDLFIERTKKYRDLIFKLKEKFPFVIVLDTPLKFCDSKYCYGYKNNTLLYKNADHLNNHGSLYLADYILDNLIKD